MSATAELKCKFAKLKYEQLLSDKYFVETCFSKKYSSYSSKQNLIDMKFDIEANSDEPISSTTIVTSPLCTSPSEDTFSNEFSNEFE